MKNENPVVWFEIYVDDINRAKKFYEAVFEYEFKELPMPESAADMEMYFFPSDMHSENRASGALVKMQGVTPGNNSTLVYFMSKDCGMEASRVEAAGGSIFKPKTSIGEYGFIVLAIDTEGNMFGIHSMN
ncbi:VOC family protein [Flagellimonas aequoris]|uniref:VOC family protein n=1 Tax=Flagellimonas aequoris TaxID=2306997 RepID=A0A418N426_9FLAO|nr:VOC family protein [Allomuricauda aequoris]RIV68566.1 VOC family protein [Allomuricauda aequoris]TXK00264.1 VOC family protein [Allomuricauda aequoris]